MTCPRTQSVMLLERDQEIKVTCHPQPRTIYVMPSKQVRADQRHDSVESLILVEDSKSSSQLKDSERADRLEIEKLKKGNVAFIPLEKENEYGTTEQQLTQGLEAQGGAADTRPETGEMNKEQDVEKTSLCLDEPISQESDSTESDGTGMEGDHVKIQDKSVRRRLFRWANEKAKSYYLKKIERTFEREQEEGDKVYQPCKIQKKF